MKGLPFVLLFTAMTFLSWGAYGPVLHHGAIALEHDSMRAFVGVGLAYFMIAVIFPFIVLKKNGEKGEWTLSGSIYSFIAGAVGAVGALGIILALGAGGETVYVMPLVFGFAPVVNTLVSAMLSRTFNQISPIFVGGIVAAALGAAGVLVFKPVPEAIKTTTSEVVDSEAVNSSVGSSDNSSAKSTENKADDASSGSAENADAKNKLNAESTSTAENESSEPGKESTSTSGDDGSSSVDVEESNDAPPKAAESGDGGTVAEEPAPDAEPVAADTEAGADSSQPVSLPVRRRNIPWIVMSIIIAALCWGSYGPMLHVGQGKMDGSRLRPFACVGMAYFLIAVAAPLVLIYARTEDVGAWNFGGMSWSFLAGVAGAIGALGVILAFNSGGKPYYVMPLIFGFAPVINTFISVTEAGTWDQVTLMFWLSLAVVIAGAVTVLTNAPRPKPKPKTA